MNTTKTTKPRNQKASKRTVTSPAPTISWTTDIVHTRHRWWWYLVIVWIGWTASLVLVVAGNWSAALVAAVATVGLIIINIGRPRRWTVTIDATTIRIERPGHSRFTYELPLNSYRAFTVVDMPAGKRDEPQKTIALMGKKRLSAAKFLVLPYDDYEADMIIQQLTDVLPFESRDGFSRSDRVIAAIARWLGLS